MKTLTYLCGPMVATVLVSTFLYSLSVSAQESDVSADANDWTIVDTQTKVDAGNALNARATDPTDSDGDGYGDLYIREGGRTVEAGNIPEKQQQQDTDDDSDGWSDAVTTTTGDLTDVFPPGPRGGIQASDNDSDVAAIKGTTKTTDWSVEEGAASMVRGGGSSEKATFESKLHEAGLSEEATTEFLTKLNRIKIDVVFDDEINEVDGSTSQWSLHNISISAENLRDWTDTDRKSYHTLKQTFNEESPEYASLLVVEHMLEDDRIKSITSDETSLKMQYRAKIKLFGLIPLEDTVVATLQLPGVDDAVWHMRVAVVWPWYARFLSTKESADTIDETVLSVAKKAKFKAGKALAETVK